jgi:hypothetical protein
MPLRKDNRYKLKSLVNNRAALHPNNPVCAGWIKKASGAQTSLDVAIGGINPLNQTLNEQQFSAFADQLIERMVSVGATQQTGELISQCLWDNGHRFVLVMAPWIGRSYFDNVSLHLKGTHQYNAQLQWWENYTLPDWM